MNARRWMTPGIVVLLIVCLAPAAGAQESAVRRGWLGFSYAAIDQNGDVTVEIEGVYPGSPAADAGIRTGDVIVRWNGSAQVGDALESLRLEPGDTVRLRIRRPGAAERNLTVVAARRPPDLAMMPPSRQAPFGLTQRDWQEWQKRLQEQQEEISGFFRDSVRMRRIDPDRIVRFWSDGLRLDSLAVHADSLHRGIQLLLRDSLGPQLRALDERVRMLRPEGTTRAVIALARRGVAGAEFEEMNEGLASYFGTTSGALVLRVSPGTPAARAGLEPGDVVLEADERQVNSVDDIREAVARAQASRNRGVSLEVLRQGERQELHITWE